MESNIFLLFLTVTNGLMWYTLQKMNFCNDEKRDKQGLQVLTHWKLPRCQCPHSSMIAIFVMMRREINKDCRCWHIENTTWLPVSTQIKCVFVVVFQNRMHLSAVPPPDASRPWRWGDQAIALTAAVCSVYFSTGCTECGFQTKSWTKGKY